MLTTWVFATLFAIKLLAHHADLDDIGACAPKQPERVLSLSFLWSWFRVSWRIAGSALLLSAASGSGLATATDLTIAVAQHALSLPLYVADNEGFFADEGVRVRLVPCVTGARCLRQLFEGTADVATAARTPIMFSSFERSDFAIVATYGSSSEDHKLVTRRGAGIERPGDLRGRRIGVTFGTTAHYFLEAYLLMNGVDPRSVKEVNIPPGVVVQALLAGQVDALATWEPNAWRALQSHKDEVSILPSAGVHTLSASLLIQRRMVGARDKDLAAMLRAVDRAVRFIRGQPHKARQVLAERLVTDMKFVEWIFPSMQFRLSLDQSLVKTLESEARWAIREKHVAATAVPNFLPLVHGAPLRAVAPDAVSIAY